MNDHEICIMPFDFFFRKRFMIIIVILCFSIVMARSPTPEEYNEFVYITKMHKYLVKYLGAMFNDADYSKHDDSKFQEPELTPYTLRFVGKLKHAENPGWKDAKEHHFSINDHHIEYWKYYANSEMPLHRLQEAVVDMMAANFQYNLCKEVTEITRINETEFDAEKLKAKLHKFLIKPVMYSFQDQFLSEYSEEQKRTITEMLNNFKVRYHHLHKEL